MKFNVRRQVSFIVVLVGVILISVSVALAVSPARRAVKEKCEQILPAEQREFCENVSGTLLAEDMLLRGDCISGCNNSTNWIGDRKALCEQACRTMFTE